MTTQWLEVKNTLEDVIRQTLPPLAGTAESEPRWRHSSQTNLMSNPDTGWKIYIRVSSVGDTQVTRRYENNEVTGNLDETIHSIKQLTVEFRAEADYHDEATAQWALTVTERTRAMLHLRSIREQFSLANMNFLGATDTVDISLMHGGRTVNAAAFDMQFQIVDEFTLENVDYFHTVLLSSCVYDEEGELIDGNFTDKVITSQ